MTTKYRCKTRKKKLTLSIDRGVIDAINSTDINISEFVEHKLFDELKLRKIQVACPFCGQGIDL